MSWTEITTAVNNQLRTPLNYLIWIQNLETYGTKGYAGKSKDIKNKLCECQEAVSEEIINTFLFDWALDNNLHIGNFFGNMYEMKFLDWKNYHTFEDVLDNKETLQSIMDNYISTPMLIGNTSWRNILTDNIDYLKTLVELDLAVEELLQTKYITFNLLNNDAVRRKIILEAPYAVEKIATDNELIQIYTSQFRNIIDTEVEWTLAMEFPQIVNLYLSHAFSFYMVEALSRDKARKTLWDSDIGFTLAINDTKFMTYALAKDGNAMKEFFFEQGLYNRAKTLENRIDVLGINGYDTFNDYIDKNSDFEISNTKTIELQLSPMDLPEQLELPPKKIGTLYLIDRIYIGRTSYIGIIDLSIIINNEINNRLYLVKHTSVNVTTDKNPKVIGKGINLKISYPDPGWSPPLPLTTRIEYREVTLKINNKTS